MGAIGRVKFPVFYVGAVGTKWSSVRWARQLYTIVVSIFFSIIPI